MRPCTERDSDTDLATSPHDGEGHERVETGDREQEHGQREDGDRHDEDLRERSSPPPMKRGTTPTIVSQGASGVGSQLGAPPCRKRMRRPSALPPPRIRSTNVSLTTTTIGCGERSPARSARPASTGISRASKNSGLTRDRPTRWPVDADSIVIPARGAADEPSTSKGRSGSSHGPVPKMATCETSGRSWKRRCSSSRWIAYRSRASSSGSTAAEACVGGSSVSRATRTSSSG